jgi:hypothetical protein
MCGSFGILCKAGFILYICLAITNIQEVYSRTLLLCIVASHQSLAQNLDSCRLGSATEDGERWRQEEMERGGPGK